MTNCPNCGAPLDEHFFKCPYCGTLYYDLTVLDDSVPCYVRFRTGRGILTTIARPELKSINTTSDYCYAYDGRGNKIASIVCGQQSDIDVEFHTMVNPNGELWRLEIPNE